MLGRSTRRCVATARHIHREQIVPNRWLHAATLERFARKPISRKTLNALAFPDLCEKNSLFASANYVKNELPTRLSHRIVDMKELPYFVLTTPSIHHVYQIYIDAFSSCSQFPPITSLRQEALFCELLKNIVSDSAEVVQLVAEGLFQSRMISQRLGLHKNQHVHVQLQEWVEKLMSSRIGRRVLAEQHIALHEAVLHGNDSDLPRASGDLRGKNGVVDMQCDVLQCLSHAILASKRVSTYHYGVSPEVLISGCDVIHLPFVRTHLEYILFELLKNAMRATVEHAGGKRGSVVAPIEEVPAVHVLVASGPSELTIRISDAGGGLKRGDRDKIFQYGYTTVGDHAAIEVDESVAEESFLGNALSDRVASIQESPIAGLGFGLPMSR